MSAYKLLINGQMVEGDLTMDVVNPATEEKLAECPRASEDQPNAAVAGTGGGVSRMVKDDDRRA